MAEICFTMNCRRLLQAGSAIAAASIFNPRQAFAQSGRSVAIAFPTGPRSLDPLFRNDAVSGSIQRHLFDTLTHRGEDMAIGLWLADSIEQESANRWRVKLREGARFTNGEPVNSEAVRYSLERALKPENKGDIRSQVTPLGKIEIVDDYNLVFETPNPDPLFKIRLTWLQIVPPKYAAEVGSQFGNKPIGSGPYVLRSWSPNSDVVFDVNPDFWGPKPLYMEVVFKSVPEEIARLSALRAGDIQIAFVLSANQATALASEPGFKIHPSLTNQVGVLNFNPLTELGGNRKFREAVAYAADPEELLKVLKELGEPVTSIFAPAIQGLPAEMPKSVEHDVERARKIVDESGLKGTTIEVGGTSGRFSLDRELISAIAAQLRRVGFDAKARGEEYGTHISDIKEGRSSPVFLQVQGNSWFDPVPQLDAFYASNGLLSPWRDPKVDDLLNKTYEVAGDDRPKAIGSVLNYIQDELMAVPLFGYRALNGAQEDIGWKRNDLFIYAFELT